jgi:basic membrane protein A
LTLLSVPCYLNHLMRLAIAAAVLLLCGGCSRESSSNGQAPPRIGLVTDVAGRGDGSFNDAALRGLETWAGGTRWTGSGYRPLSASELEKLSPHRPLGIRPIVLLSRSQEDYEPNLQLVVDQGAQLTIGNGFMLENALERVARKNPRAFFLLVDSPLFDPQGQPLSLPNVRSVTFREEEGSFLAGVLAARVSRTGKVGFVGGMALPLIERFEAGFRAGVRAASQSGRAVETYTVYTGGFDNVSRGKQLASDLLGRGADLLFHAAGGDGLGVIQAVKEARARGVRAFAIGCDSDQHALAPDAVITSMIKRVDWVVYQAARDAVGGTLQGGHRTLGLKEDAVALAPIRLPSEQDRERDALLAEIERYTQLIQTGAIQVPAARQP